uniref:P4Hc domain-containing protein n=1 Tax=Panagrellus redivivus TaxID=6233 RepID=A0A7E4VHN2_PANRE
MAQGPATFHEDLFELNPAFSNPEFRENVRNILAGNAPDSAPFPHFTLADFFVKPEALKALRNELKRAKWTAKANDLYSFWRTGELDKYNAEKFPALTAFALFMKTHVRELVMELTGCELTEKISVAGSRYDQTDVLLPHDDRMEERKFAFILYLTPEWEESYGGDLNLFNSDDRIEPTTIAKRITPRSNNFLFFDIRPQSWHSVGEVTAPKKQRLSLNGWFHCKVANINRNPAPLPPLNKLSPHESSSLDDVQLWVNGQWRNEADIENIQKVFAKRSEISIKHFVPTDTYAQALVDLKKAKFTHVGPPNLMNVEQLDESALAEGSLLKKLFVMARSDALTLLITQWTGLHLFDMNSLVESASEPSEGGDPPVPESSPSGDEAPPAANAKRARVDSGNGPEAKRARLDPSEEPSTSAASDAAPKDLPMEGVASSSSTTQGTPSKPKKLRTSPVPSPKDFENIRVVTFLNKYTKGSYTLADDRLAADRNANGYCFDLLIFFKEDPRWNQEAGGFYSYIAANDPEEVLRVWPRSNVAAFVFREPEVLNFTKYINCLAGDDTFYVFQATYFGFSPESDSDSSASDEDTDAEEAAEADDDDLEDGYVENTRNYSYHTGHSSSDEDEDGDLQNEPPPLVDREIKFSPPPSPVPEDRDSEEEEEEPEDEEEEEQVAADDESEEEAVPEAASPEPLNEDEEDNDLPALQPVPDADSDPDDEDASVSSESASSTGSINSAATDDLPPAPLEESGSDSEDTVSSTDSEQPMINLMQNHNQLPPPPPPVHHNNQDILEGSGLEPEVDDSDIDENDPPFN